MKLRDEFTDHIRSSIMTALRNQGDYAHTARLFMESAHIDIVRQLATFGGRNRIDAIIRVAAKRELAERAR